MKKFTAFIALLFMVLMVAAPAGAAPSFTKLSETLMGNLRAVVYKVAFDSSYPTGGEDITRITTDNFSTVLSVIPDGDAVSGMMPAYDYSNGTLKLYVSGNAAGPVEIQNGSASAVGVSTRVLIIGW